MQEQETSPSFFTRLGRGIWRVIRFVLLIIILSAIGVILVFSSQRAIAEINRSFENINRRFDIQAQRIDGFEQDIDGLLQADDAAAEAQRELRLDVTRQATDLSDQAAALDGLQQDLTAQSAVLATLSARVSANEQAAADLDASVAALQGDLNGSNSRIDDLGGELDALGGQVTQNRADTTSDLMAFRAEYATPSEEVAAVLKALQYFRVWEVVARARLRLAESNPGLAQVDVRLVLAMVDDLSAADAAAAADLAAVRERLALADASLPADPTAAGRDLEAAWEALDRLLGLLLVPPAASAEAPTPAVEPTLGAPTPAPTATP